MDRLQWWRLPFLFPSWSPWYLKVNQLVVLPALLLYNLALVAVTGGEFAALCWTGLTLGLFLACVDSNVEHYLWDQRLRLKLGGDW